MKLKNITITSALVALVALIAVGSVTYYFLGPCGDLLGQRSSSHRYVDGKCISRSGEVSAPPDTIQRLETLGALLFAVMIFGAIGAYIRRRRNPPHAGLKDMDINSSELKFMSDELRTVAKEDGMTEEQANEALADMNADYQDKNHIESKK